MEFQARKINVSYDGNKNQYQENIKAVIKMARDPICGMMVDPQMTRFKAHVNGKTYYFCSNTCMTQFERDPSKYVKKKGLLTRFLEWIGRANEKKYGNKPPSCCGQ